MGQNAPEKKPKTHDMNGSIHFKSAASLAAFLLTFAGSTAAFRVTQDDGERFTLTFTGAY